MEIDVATNRETIEWLGLEEWLSGMGLEKYIETLKSQELTDPGDELSIRTSYVCGGLLMHDGLPMHDELLLYAPTVKSNCNPSSDFWF
jgi:hypothetical protein